MICPKCKENKAHRSRRSGFMDWAASLTLRMPYRCHACQARTYISNYGADMTRVRTAEERRVIQLRRNLKVQKIKRELVAYGIGLLTMLALLYYLFQQRD